MMSQTNQVVLADYENALPAVELNGQVRASEDVEPGIVNLNPLANAMADAQGVPVGSWHWMLGGVAPFSGSSGEHSSYGWNHAHKLSPSYIRAVLANYGHRRIYYDNAPYRQFGYEAGGRPHGWTQESPGDQPDGSVVYMNAQGQTTRVTGPEPEHLWLSPLFTLIDDPDPIMVDTGLGTQLPSNVVAKWLATQLVSASVGMVRDHRTQTGAPYPWTYGDRATCRILHTIVEGHKRGCLPNDDIPTAAAFMADIVLAFYEKGPGIHQFGAVIDDPEAPQYGRFPMGLFNGLHWNVPVCYDAAQMLRDGGMNSWADRFSALVTRWSNWMADMHKVLPHECFRADIVYLDPSFALRDTPPESIEGLIQPNSFNQSWDYKPWAFRALDIASNINASLKDAREAIANEYGGRDGHHWMVAADGKYV